MSQTKATWVDFKEIKAQISIVPILERYGALQALQRSENGDRLSGACPIHGGTNKTHFRVSASKNCWNCFGTCQCGGNVIDFVAKKEGVPFRDAALLLQKWFLDSADEIPEPAARPRFDTSGMPATNRYPMPEHKGMKAAEVETGENKPLQFELSSLDPEHPYLRERGLTAETVAAFGLGYCAKGLLRGHLAIPIHNASGDLIAYAGRLVKAGGKKAKYKLPRGFMKSLEVFNLHRAVRSVQRTPLVVVEGFFDCFMLHQARYERTVAIMGSSLSEAQEMILKEASSEMGLILFLDNDEAGRKGQQDALCRLARHTSVRMVNLKDEGCQPEHLSAEQLRASLPFPDDKEVA